MDNSNSFKHIKVTPAVEDEIIQAGVVPKEEKEISKKKDDSVLNSSETSFIDSSTVFSVDAVLPKNPPDDIQREQNSSQQGEKPEEDNDAISQEEIFSKEKTKKKPLASSKRVKADSYEEQTLEDLERTPMPLAQRIVIIAAIALIFIAVVYYFVFMR